MLCLSRYSQQSLVIGDDIKVTVLGIKGNQVRLGIEAPDHIAVHRKEVHDRIKALESRQMTP